MRKDESALFSVRDATRQRRRLLAVCSLPSIRANVFLFVVKFCMGVCCVALGYLYCVRASVLGKSVARLHTSNALVLLG